MCLSSGELVVMERETNFFLASSQTHGSLLVTWGNWDNTVVVQSVGFESGSVRLHHHPLNKVRKEEEEVGWKKRRNLLLLRGGGGGEEKRGGGGRGRGVEGAEWGSAHPISNLSDKLHRGQQLQLNLVVHSFEK